MSARLLQTRCLATRSSREKWGCGPAFSVRHTAHNCSGLALTGQYWSRALSVMDPGNDVRVNGSWQPPELREWQDPHGTPMVLLLVVPGLGIRTQLKGFDFQEACLNFDL